MMQDIEKVESSYYKTKGGQTDNFYVPIIVITFWPFSLPINCSNCSYYKITCVCVCVCVCV